MFAGGLYCLASMGMVLLNKVRYVTCAGLRDSPNDRGPAAARAWGAERCEPAVAGPAAALLAQATHLCHLPSNCASFLHCAWAWLLQVALSTFHFRSTNALLFFQCLVCVVSVKLCQALGVVKGVEPFSMKVTRVW